MQEIFQTIWHYAEQIEGLLRTHSADVLLFSVGAIGSAIADNRSNVEFTSKERFIRLCFGGATAMFSADLIVLLINTYTDLDIEMGTRTSACVGFFIGHTGMEGITSVMIKVKDIFKKNK